MVLTSKRDAMVHLRNRSGTSRAGVDGETNKDDKSETHYG